MFNKHIARDVAQVMFQPPLSSLKWYFKRVLHVFKYRQAIICPGARIAGDSILGKNVFVGNNAIISDCRVGRFSYFSPEARCHNATVGSFCSIGHEVVIGLSKHPTQFVSTSPVFYSPGNWAFRTKFTEKQMFDEHASVQIGSDVWIGARAMITDGVKIGDGAVIASAAMVVKNVAPYSIVGGVPARLIRMRFNEEQIERLMALKWWDKSEDWLKQHGPKFHDLNFLLDFLSKPQ